MVHQPAEEARPGLAEAVGEEFADAILNAWAVMAGQPEPVSQDVPDVLGRPALTFQQWARDHVSDFAAPRSVQ